LFFDPSSSDSVSSEDPDYIPPIPTKRIITTSDDSWPENSNSQTSDQPSTSKQGGNQNNPTPDSDNETSTDSESVKSSPKDKSPTPVTSPRGRPQGSKNLPDSWKNTAATKWKPPKKIVVEIDPGAIATRTRSRQAQDVTEQNVTHPHDLNIDAVCCNESKQERAKSPSGFQKNRELCYRCALSPCENSSKHVQNH
jgi:hypothetical protein